LVRCKKPLLAAGGARGEVVGEGHQREVVTGCSVAVLHPAVHVVCLCPGGTWLVPDEEDWEGSGDGASLYTPPSLKTLCVSRYG